MSQVNVNAPPPAVDEHAHSHGDRTAAAGVNFLTVLLVLGALAVLAWFLFTGPLASMTGGGTGTGNTNINVNPPAQQAPNIQVNPPSQPSGGTGTGGTGGTGGSAPAQPGSRTP